MGDGSATGSKRSTLLLGLGMLSLAIGGPASAARPTNKEVDNAESPYIQELLRRSEEKREERKQERLNNYYKKVFREYFEFDGGSPEAARARGLSEETAAAYRKWLDDNDDQRMPGLRKRSS